MAKTLGKGDLQKEKLQLKLYKKLLPSLDLKRTQLTAEYSRMKLEMANLQKEVDETMADALEKLPMLANRDVDLHGLVKINSLVIEEQSVMGVKVPKLKEIIFDVKEYAMLATPSWIESYILHLKKVIAAKMRVKLASVSAEKLKGAVRRITQHVNLFEKILIPTAQKNIRKIQILLGEAERSAVVRSKLAKALHMRQNQPEYFVDTLS